MTKAGKKAAPPASPNGNGNGKCRVYSTSPLFLRIHKSGTSCGIYIPVPMRIALGVRAGDALRATLQMGQDGEPNKLVLERAR